MVTLDKENAMSRYIFMAGAPGSKWSSVFKNIYYSPDIDRSDYSDARTYYHSAWGQPELMHLGAYFDPGMEFGDWFDQMDQFHPRQCEIEFDRPFTGQGTRIIKSHVFCAQLDFIKANWPDCPIILVHRPNDACLGWWVRCREFRISYPRYRWYQDLDHMAAHIDYQNQELLAFAEKHGADWTVLGDNLQLCSRLGITPPVDHWQSYPRSDVKVAVL